MCTRIDVVSLNKDKETIYLFYAERTYRLRFLGVVGA
jgi:hypothetical protein